MLSLRPFSADHFKIFSMSELIWKMTSSIKSGQWDKCSWQSLAYKRGVQYCIQEGKSEVYRLKSIGPNQLPWGTPRPLIKAVDMSPSYFVTCNLSTKTLHYPRSKTIIIHFCQQHIMVDGIKCLQMVSSNIKVLYMPLPFPSIKSENKLTKAVQVLCSLWIRTVLLATYLHI